MKSLKNTLKGIGKGMVEKEYFVYLLRCSDQSLYCGITTNLERRIKEHNSKTGSKYTRSRLPVKLVYYEDGFNKSQALKRELDIKSLSKIEKEKLVSNKE